MIKYTNTFECLHIVGACVRATGAVRNMYFMFDQLMDDDYRIIRFHS